LSAIRISRPVPRLITSEGQVRMRVILVEDNEHFRSLLRSLLERVPGYEIVGEASSGDIAVELIKNTPADLVLLDLSLPKLSGISVLEQVRKFTAVKVLVLTIYGEGEMITHAVNAGADGICGKDLSRQELLDAVEMTLKGEHPMFLSNT
jgi:DNA-binding NarL/FixJ family response regulator